ncbi:MAG TPA: hypothetical protein VHB25_00270 [Gemmatimonadaceae bacterium]|nr:hypothetical protein [Gemmatimonadaceae bacterium]
MSGGSRAFGALIAHDGVCLVEYETERTGMRVVEQWTDPARAQSIDEALGRLRALIEARGSRQPRVAIAIEQFGVFHHTMTLPGAADDVLLPVVRREVQRVFGVADPVVSFARGGAVERREGARADERTAPRQLFIGGAPRAVADALTSAFRGSDIRVEVATVVPKAIHSLYEATGSSLEPTAVLVCLEGGPHLAFFLEGRLELAIDPPIALEGERHPVPMILDQVERGTVYFRQQFRGAQATRLLLAAPADEFEALASTLESRLGVRVKPLFTGASSPAAIVAMGAVLEARHAAPLDLFPHPPTASQRIARALRGPNAIVAAAASAAMLAALWAASQFWALQSTRRESAALEAGVRQGITQVAPIRDVAQRRADAAKQVEFIRASTRERSTLAAELSEVAGALPAAVRLDSILVSRAKDGWATSIEGTAAGETTADAVRALDLFYSAVRGRSDVSDPNLDQFDYATPTAVGDTAAKKQADAPPTSGGPVTLQFRMSFTLARVRTSDATAAGGQP